VAVRTGARAAVSPEKKPVSGNAHGTTTSATATPADGVDPGAFFCQVSQRRRDSRAGTRGGDGGGNHNGLATGLRYGVAHRITAIATVPRGGKAVGKREGVPPSGAREQAPPPKRRTRSDAIEKRHASDTSKIKKTQLQQMSGSPQHAEHEPAQFRRADQAQETPATKRPSSEKV